MKYVFLGLSITSSWGNGHATTYRSLVKELSARGHDVLFLERDVTWYADNRDMPKPPYGRTRLYRSVAELKRRHVEDVRNADAVILGSYVPDGIEVARWVTRTARGVTAFYDIDTPITVAGLSNGGTAYLTRNLVPCFDLYLSFTGGPILERLEKELGAQSARALYCSVDAGLYYPEDREDRWCLGYLGTYSDDRQPALKELLLRPAEMLRGQRFIVAGPQYPTSVQWPANVERKTHIAPADHRAFYGSQRFTLNITRAEMLKAGFSPSVRLFEAAACGTAIISDAWPGLDSVFVPGHEILVAQNSEQVVELLHDLGDEERKAIGMRARARISAAHTAAHRAAELDQHVLSVRSGRSDITQSSTPVHSTRSAQEGA